MVVCLNISGMMLVRSAMRERELSIRHAIGASRGRLARYLLSEAIVLAGLGAVLGSVVLFNVPRCWPGPGVPFRSKSRRRCDSIRPSSRSVSDCAWSTSVVFGFLPAARFSRPVIISSLKDDAGVGGFQAGRVHRLTAALQVAIAVPLIVLSAIALDRVARHRNGRPRIRVRLVVRGAVELRRCRGRECRAATSEAPATTSRRRAVSRPPLWPMACRWISRAAARGSRCRWTTTVPRESPSSRRHVSVTVIWTPWVSRSYSGAASPMTTAAAARW